MLKYGTLPVFKDCRGASPRRLRWSVSEGLLELGESLLSSWRLLECAESCLSGEPFLAHFVAPPALPSLWEELYTSSASDSTSTNSGDFLFAESLDLFPLDLPDEPLGSLLLSLLEDEEDFTLSLPSKYQSSPGLSGESISFGTTSFRTAFPPSELVGGFLRGAGSPRALCSLAPQCCPCVS